MAINDVLPLKAARRDAVANLKNSFGSPRHRQPNVDGFICIHNAAPPYSARIRTVHLLPFGKVWLGSVCSVQRLTTKQNATFTEGAWVGEIYGPILTHLWTKVHKIFRRYRRFFVVPSDALARLSMSRFVQKIFAIMSRSRRKTEQM